MPAYVIFIREGEILDPEAMTQYQRSNRDGPRNPDLKPLVIYGALENLEGDAPDGVVMLEFPTMEAAKAWYFSPAYQAAAVHRRNAAHYRAFIVEGLSALPG